ncbi:MAG TPA: DUF1800 domain-containing protein [Candidatus Acidoferrum sp.]|nr:DUF1800 domain-containing protein [Candidatus Acidoferrum sp.]
MRLFAKTAIALALIPQLCAPAIPQSTTTSAANKSSAAPAAVKSEPASSPHHAAIATAAALTDAQHALHALNRLTFGPRPGDVQTVLSQGVDSWIEDQLHPESIDDSALNARLAPYATTRMNAKLLAQSFPSDGVIRQVMAGKRQVPDDPALKLVYAVNVARLQQQDAAKTTPPPAMSGAPDSSVAVNQPSSEDEARALADTIVALPKEKRLAAFEATPPEKLVNFPNLLRPDQRDRLSADFTPQEREVFRAFANPQAVVASELQQAKLIREVYSERQLLEVMTDFWFNHFNVYQYKNQDVFYTTAYERDVIRPRALGKFYDLLVAVAESPAMLMYLDNWLSIGPHSQAAGKNGQSGLNENYGRELMELHTLGVDGGYTQADVTQLATVLTGWTIAQPDDGGQFQFDPKRHEPGDKTVLGEKFYAAGQDEGMRALDALAHRPATAHFISRCIATRFVSDDPPESLVARMAATFQSSDGDIREVMRTMLHSPEFWSSQVYKAKLKTPLEFVVSVVRASGATVVAPDALVQNLTAMGMQPYAMAVPTGYSMKSEQWENEGALLTRINFATTLTQGKLPGVQFDPSSLVVRGALSSADMPKTKAAFEGKHTSLDVALALTEDAILQGDFSAKDEKVIRTQMQDPDVERRMTASPLDGLRLISGFILASPDFQRR